MKNDKVTDWDDPKRNLTYYEVPDVLDDYFRWVDKLIARNKELEESLDQHILLEDIKSKEIRQLKLELAWKDRE